jgi:CxxC motif-containing protein (DUF1111 family)
VTRRLRDFRPRKSSTIYYIALIAAIWAILIPLWILGHASHASLRAAQRGAELFQMRFTPAQGLGPLFNKRACSGCHGFPTAGGVGANGLATELRIGRLTEAGFDPMLGRGGPFARAHSISELGIACGAAPGIPAGANVTSVRNSPPLFGDGLIDEIPDRVILARSATEHRQGMLAEPNLVPGADGHIRVGRFGWKADIPTLTQFVAGALRNELGVTNPLAATDFAPPGATPCPGKTTHPDVGNDVVSQLTAFVDSLAAPQPQGSQPSGGEIFVQAGCAVCHTPTLQGDGVAVHLYSDLLLHDMGPALDDRVTQGSAHGSQWRTAPLWGLHERTRYLHDGRATTLRAAILDHGGQAKRARQRFLALAPRQQQALLRFLSTL